MRALAVHVTFKRKGEALSWLARFNPHVARLENTAWDACGAPTQGVDFQAKVIYVKAFVNDAASA